MTLADWSELARLGASVAAILGVGSAILGAVLAWRKLSADRAAAQEVRAKALVVEHLRRAFDHPRFADPPPLAEFEPLELRRYEWFVGLMLYAYEEVLRFEGWRDWTATIGYTCGLHGEFFRSEGFARQRVCYSPQLLAIVDRIAAAAPRP